VKPLFRDKNPADMPVNAICYDLTDGGDTVRGKPYLWDKLRTLAFLRAQLYRDLEHLTVSDVDRQVNRWLEHNERK